MTTNDDASTILVVEDDSATRTFLADNLSADGYDLLVADCASIGLQPARAQVPRPRARRHRPARRQRLRPAAPRAQRRRRREPDRPRHAADRHQRPRDRARPRPRLRARGRRLHLQAVLLSRAARPRRRAAAARRRAPVARAPAGRAARGRPAVARGPAARRARRAVAEGVRAAARARLGPDAGSSPRRSCCARSGATGRSARRARWTRTPAGCATSSAPTATASSSTCGASATGSSTRRAVALARASVTALIRGAGGELSPLAP